MPEDDDRTATRYRDRDGARLGTVLREWGRIGCIGFGGPPTHVKLLRELCLQQRRWLDPGEFEDAIAACDLLPGPASTQLATFCAWRIRGRAGAIVGGVAFIVPGLALILALSALFLEGAIFGATIPLTRALSEPWQYAVLVGAGVMLLERRRNTVLTLLAAGTAGVVISLAGGPLPR